MLLFRVLGRLGVFDNSYTALKKGEKLWLFSKTCCDSLQPFQCWLSRMQHQPPRRSQDFRGGISSINEVSMTGGDVVTVVHGETAGVAATEGGEVIDRIFKRMNKSIEVAVNSLKLTIAAVEEETLEAAVEVISIAEDAGSTVERGAVSIVVSTGVLTAAFVKDAGVALTADSTGDSIAVFIQVFDQEVTLVTVFTAIGRIADLAGTTDPAFVDRRGLITSQPTQSADSTQLG
ncbi:MAG: hypothetical protein AAF583_08180 [Pseudomonadota bacterium]